MTFSQWIAQYVIDFAVIKGGFQINLSYLGIGIVGLVCFLRLRRLFLHKRLVSALSDVTSGKKG